MLLVISKTWCLPLAIGLCALMTGVVAAEGPAPPNAFSEADLEFFEKDIRPLLANHCQKCHGAHMQKGGLRLDSRAAALAGGDTGPAVVPGKPDQSLLIDAVNYGELYQMPPTGKLAEADVSALRRWIEEGAAWPAEAAPVSGEV